MKYLKKFESVNESVSIVTEIRELTNNCLAYLMDDDICSLSMEPRFNRDKTRSIDIKLHIDERHWVDIKDYIIPYIEIMNNTFYFKKNIGEDDGDTLGISYYDLNEEEHFHNYLSIEELIKGDLDFIEECDGEDYINQIEFIIERKRRE